MQNTKYEKSEENNILIKTLENYYKKVKDKT